MKYCPRVYSRLSSTEKWASEDRKAMLGYWEAGRGVERGAREYWGEGVGGRGVVQGGLREGGFWQKSWHHSTTLSTAGLLSRRVMMM